MLFIDIGKLMGPLIPKILIGIIGFSGWSSSSSTGSYPSCLRISITSSFVCNSCMLSFCNMICCFLSSITAFWAYLSFSRVLISFYTMFMRNILHTYLCLSKLFLYEGSYFKTKCNFLPYIYYLWRVSIPRILLFNFFIVIFFFLRVYLQFQDCVVRVF